MNKRFTLVRIALVGVMAAAVYVASAFLQIPIPTAIDNTRLHMGNVMCLLAGFLLGSWQGGLAAGIGSMFFDLTNPAYIASAPFTFIFKFLMAWLCGLIAEKKSRGKTIPEETPDKKAKKHHPVRYIIGGCSGAFLYVLLYLSKSFVEHRFIAGIPIEAVLVTISQKAVVSVINAVVAVCVAVPLGLALRPVIRKYFTK